MNSGNTPSVTWLTWRKAVLRTSIPKLELRPMLVSAGVALYRPSRRRELIDGDQFESWMRSQRAANTEERARLRISIRARAMQDLAARRASRGGGDEPG